MSGGNTALNLAMSVLAIYLLFGPMILLGIYACFDRLAEKEGRSARKNQEKQKKTDPALWNDSDLAAYLREKP